MKPILVHVHIYYTNLWPELIPYLKNISPYKYELFISMVEHNEDIQQNILNHFPNANIEIFKNIGYDVAPFIDILNRVNLDDYSYIIKLHTKRDMPLESRNNCHNVSGNKWRNYALSILSSKNHFQKILNNFKTKEYLGMVNDYRLIINNEPKTHEAIKKSAKSLFKKMQLSYSNITFIAGTMFIARASLLKPIQTLNLTMQDFEIPDRSLETSMAHTIERLLGMVIKAQNYEIKDCITNKYFQYYHNLYVKIYFFIYRKKITKNGYMIIKLFKIPVYYKKINSNI
jgi:lipopolysaccharide biosynthesis protein